MEDRAGGQVAGYRYFALNFVLSPLPIVFCSTLDLVVQLDVSDEIHFAGPRKFHEINFDR